MKPKWAYDYPDDKLVTEVIRIAASAGVANSGLVMDVMAGSQRRELRYWRGVLLARLDNIRPPLERDQIVKAKTDTPAHLLISVNHSEGHHRGHAEQDSAYTITRIFYEGDGKWSLLFKNDELGFRYRAEYFEGVDIRMLAEPV